MKKLIRQIVRFGGVGVLCFLIDYGILNVLTEYAKVYYLLSATISFSVSVIVNYVLSTLFVFDVDKSHSRVRDLLLFVVFSVIGLGLTAGIMKLGVDWLAFDYRLVKIVATAIVMVYNFVTRKLFLERPNKS